LKWRHDAFIGKWKEKEQWRRTMRENMEGNQNQFDKKSQFIW